MLVRQLLLQAFLILLNAFFACTEIAVISLNATKLRKMEEEGDKSAGRLLKLVEQPSNFLSTIQIGITLANLLGSAFAADNFSDGLVNWVYNDLNFQASPLSVLNTLSVILITIILSYFTLIFGELVPKRVAMQKPMLVGRIAAPVVSGLGTIMRPVIWFLSFSTNLVLRLLHVKTEAQEESVTEEEIRMMIELGGEKGTIDEDEETWIQNVFRFDDITVSDAMTHVSDVVALDVDMDEKEIVKIIEESGLSRYPVYDEDINDILGILYARDFLLNLNRPDPRPFRELIRSAYFVPESIHADILFQDMQQKKIHIAVVVDEYGSTAGIITVEDLLEEIVGNIYDEFDPAEPPEIVQVEDNLWRVEGGTSLEDLEEAMDIELPEDINADTVNGLILNCLRSIPDDGSSFDVTTNGLEIHVENVEDKMVTYALIRKLPEETPDEEEEDDDREHGKDKEHEKNKNKDKDRNKDRDKDQEKN